MRANGTLTHALAACLLAGVLALASTPSSGATPRFALLLDTDANPATGCTIATPGGAASGVELVATTVVSTSTLGATVTRLERQACSNGALGTPVVYDGGGWPVGFGNGTGSSAVVESSIPRALLPASGTLRATAVASDGAAWLDATSAFNVVLTAVPATATAVPVPLSPWLVPPLALLLMALAGWWKRRHPASWPLPVLLLAAALSGIAWAAAVLRDGNVGDWAGVLPAVLDASGDAPVNTDLVAVFHQQDAAHLYVRFDADVRRDNAAPVVSAGANQSITLPAVATLAGNATDDGLPNPPGALTLAWSKVSGPGTVSFANASAAVTTAAFGAAGSYVLRLTAGDGALTTSADVTILVNPPGAANLAPVVNAGSNQSITLPASATLAGSVTDDGLPNPPGAVTVQWTKLSGPGNVTFGNATSAATTASFSAAGVHVLRLTANDGALTASADVTITVNAGGGGANQPPTVNAGANQTITLPAAASLAGSASDDGLPNPPGVLTTTWSVVSGPPAGVGFANPAAPATSATFTAPGTYVLQLAANDGTGPVTSTVTIVVNDGAPQIAAIADRTITLGDRFQQVLQAVEGNIDDTLTFTLTSAPAGATLAPSPLIDWLPSAAQIGVNTFTARVTDSGGRSTSTTFRVTVVRANRPPLLQPQPDAALPPGSAFSRTLAASDPDGDPLAYALVSAPPGLTLNGNAIAWTAPPTPGDYGVSVRVTDPDGAVDTRAFTLTVLPALPPLAKPDSYRVQLGQTLTVRAPGVLGNDLAAFGRSLTAQKLTDPDKGSLTAFNADGSFTFQAPPTNPPAAFTLVEAWRNDAAGQSINTFPVVGDVNGDGHPDYLLSSQFVGHRAVDGRTGATLWNIDPTGWGDCRFDFPTTSAPLLADIDDDGKLEFVGALAGCERDSRVNSPGYAPADRIFAVDASTGRVKWATQISARMGDALAPGNPPSTEERFQHVYDGAGYASPAVARFSAGEPPTVLYRKMVSRGESFYQPVTGPARSAGCRGLTGRLVDDGAACRATILMNGDGSVREMLVAPNPTNSYQPTWDPWRELAPFAVDLDGDGTIEIVSGSDVWQRVGGAWTLRWQSEYEPVQALAADLDGDGAAEVVHFHAFDKTGGGSGSAANPAGSLYRFHGIQILDGKTGAELRRIRLPFYWTAWLTIADADADGAPDFVINSQGTVMVIGSDGSIKWTYAIPPGQIGFVEGARSGVANAQVYDLDGDGVPEVVTNSHSEVVVLNGRTGAVKARFPSAGRHGGYYAAHNVQIGDFDNDGHADILATNISAADRMVYALYRGAPNDWLPGPKIHHQVNFIVGDVADDGRVQFNTKVPRSFRNPAQLGTVGDPRRALGTSFTYAAHDGVAPSAPAGVFIELLPVNRPPVITSTPPRALWQRFAPNPPGGLVTNYYDVAAYDPDAGDTLTWSLVSPAAWVTIDAGTGRIRFEPTCGSYGYPCPWGWTFVTVRVTDTHGAFADQSFMVNLDIATVTVPDVVGQAFDDAATLLRSLKLGAVRHAEVFDARPEGTVLNQIASAGATVAQWDDVLLTVSKGPQPVIVPHLVGQDLGAARLALQGLGLAMTVAPQASTSVPRNQVMAQAPAGGTAVVPGTATPVALTVSAGSAPAGTIARLVVEPGNAARLVGDVVSMKATAVFADGTAADVTLNALWSSSASGVATVDTTGSVRALAAGPATISASVGSTTGQATLTVATQTGDTTPPTAAITSPAEGADVIGPVGIVGTASDANFHRYELAVAPAGESTWTVVAEGTSAVVNGTLGTLDPAVLVNDQYALRLTVVDRGGNTSEALTTVQVRGDRKVGLFTLTFQDLNVALTGVPITVTRTYDSRDKSTRDFGVGWRLGLDTLRLRTNRVLGTGWERVQAGPASSLQARAPHKVSLTLPDGRVEEFDLQLSPTSGLGVLQSTRVTGFAPRPGTQGRLEGLDNPDLLVVSAGAEDLLVDDGTLEPYDPKRFRYTALDGTRIELHRMQGVERITDRNGNAITFGPAGILHSGGQSVVFTRDAQGRITSIRDLNGNVQTYAYDGNGDLVAHTDPAGGVARYAYNRHHGLIEMRNPSGTGVTRNDYDASGRLVAMTDAAGRQIAWTHDENANEDRITDRLGRQTRLLYDAQGNVTRQERAVTIDGTLVNAITAATFDALGNTTSTVDPDGQRHAATYNGLLPVTRSVDPGGLDLVQTFTYGARNDVATAVDAGSRTYSFTYDASGNLTGAAVPATGALSVVNDARGQPVERRDALGTRTVSTFDAAGRVVREDTIDSGAVLLRRVDFTWDANGNKTSETLHRTVGGAAALTTRYAYDAANRVVAITDPLGGVTRTEYDPGGLVAATVDALGRRTTYGHDTLGRRTRITYPDGTFETWTYDAEGNATSATDRAGRTTAYFHDELNRRVRTLRPDGTSTRVVYSAGGRVIATIDALGQRTDYAYDAAGRRTSTTLPAVPNGPGGALVRPQHATTPNALGLPASITDPNGRVTTFQYDAEGRLVRTTHPDGSTIVQTWDALGRRASVTNEDGEQTTFRYDGLGRLVAVAGRAGDATYAYDEAGNLVTETDALGRTSRYRYDGRNRLVERQYPGGETERFAYDAVDNRVARTDASGRTTTFAYDAMNRLVAKTLPGGATVTYAYAPDGQRTAVTTPRGTTAFAYDALGQLASVSHPTGETVRYTRDGNGNVLSVATPAATTGHAYDALGRLVGTTTPEGQHTSAYDLAGNRVRRTGANGIVTDATFDVRNRPTLITHRAGGGTPLQSFAVAWSNGNRRTRITELDGSIESYAYDARGRLVAETRTGTHPYAITHGYDAVGNRIQTVRGGATTTFAYDANDRLVAAGNATLGWDANGNLATRSEGGTLTRFAHDAEDRLVAVSGGGIAEQYAYDDDGHRVEVGTAAHTTRYLVDSANPTGFAQVLEERDGAGALQARYAWGSDLVALSGAGAASFPLRDALGSTRALADASGALTDGYHFDAFGGTVAAQGSTPNPYRYRGERQDAATGFYQLRARYYSPSQGRFLSRDPFNGHPAAPVSRHRYLYADADPVNRIDPSGRSPLVDVGLAQWMSNLMDTATFVRTVRTACTVKTTLDQVNELLFYGNIGLQLATAVPLIALQGSTEFQGGTIKGGVTGEIPLIDIGRAAVDNGELNRVTFGLTFGSGKGGVKGSLGIAGRPSIDLSATTPPPDFKFGVSSKASVILKEFTSCGISLGRIELEPNVKAYGYEGDGGGLAGSVDVKFSLFQGRFKAGFSLMGVDLSTRGISVMLGGAIMGLP